MGISDKPCLIELKTSFFVQIFFIHRHAENLREKHMVGTQFLDLRDPALDIHRTFLNHRSQLQVLRSAGRQPRLFEFIHIPPGTDPAVIRRPGQGAGGQVDHKLPPLL